MKKNAKKFFSMLLALALVLSMVPMTAFATETEEEAAAETVAETAEEATTSPAEEDADDEEKISFNVSSLAPALLNADEVEVDEDDPAIIALEAELKNIKVLNADGESVALTEEQIQTVVGMYQQYLDHWAENANVLGAQTPLFLSYNDDDDSLGILGEMLMLSKIEDPETGVKRDVTVDDVRNGNYTYDDLTGMIQTFLFADQLGVQIYGSTVTSVRDEVLALVEESGAMTDVQKYMVINNWLAQNVVFDMPYIMNTDKEEDEKPMVAENPQKHESYDTVYDVIYGVYEDTFEQQIVDGLKAEMQKQFYIAAIEQGYYDGVYAQVEAQMTDAIYQEAYEAAYQDAYDEAYAEYIAENTATESETTDPTTSEPATAAEEETTAPTEAPEETTAPTEAPEETTEPTEGEEATLEEQADAYAKEQAEIAADAAGDAAVEAQAETIKEQASATAQSETDAFMEENSEAINSDPVAFAESAFGADAAAEMATQWDATWADWEKNGVPGMVAQIKLSAYQAAIKDALVQNGQTEEEADAFLEQNADAIAEDPYAFCVSAFGQDAADQMEAGINDQLTQMGIDPSTETNPEGRVSLDVIVAMQMDTPMDDLGGLTPNEMLPIVADQITEAILNYWQGSQFGALARGSAVCLGYTKAFAYLVQCLHSDIYTTDGDIDNAASWKTNEELYYTDGELDITKDYAVDCVRITFDADVTMYGETQENFNSDHFWNAVKVDGKWYYIDPCYVDVYTQVMIRDRVETDGSLNYLYFMFSHGTTTSLYDGYYSEIKTLYADAASYTDYEDSWISRVKSSIYSDGTNFYYVYDSTDMVTLMEEYENSTDASDVDIDDSEYKLVRHTLDSSDAGDNGDSDYTALIEFNHPIEEDSDETVARVRDADGNLVENEMLTELFAQHQDDREIYPSLAITCAKQGNVLYFNLSNCLLSYDLDTCEVALVKEYNTVYGVRDDTNPFGGLAFTTTTEANADFTIENHPIAGICLKDDGSLYVSIATNFAFISGKDPHNSADQGSYGYEFEETNYNSSYNSYTNEQYEDNDMYESMGYEAEENDNDEFMWSANFVETLDMSHLAGTSHSYESVSVEASCRHNAYTENRCTTCGAIEAGSRVEVEDTAHAHHYVEFYETYYTKGDNDNWNSGTCYVCTECLFAISEPTEPDPDEDYESYGTTYEEQLAIYEEEKAIYDDAVATAGHTYMATDATWNEDYSTATFTTVTCSANCPETHLDCLVDDDTITRTFSNAATISGSDMIGYTGDCTEGAYCHYRIVGETNGITVTAETAVQLEPGEHPYESQFTWTQVTDENGNVVYMDNGYAQYTASAVLTCGICGDTHTDESADVTVEVIAPTIEEQGKVLYTAKAIATNDSGTQIGSATGVLEITLVASPEVTVSNIASTGKIKLTWGEVDGAEKYNVYRSTDGGENYSLLKTVTGTSLKNTSAVTGETYYYYVTAVSDDDMESTDKVVHSRICKLPRPDVTAGNKASTGKPTLKWDAVDGAVKYEVYRSTDGGKTYTKLTSTSKTTITNTSAETGVKYYYKVMAIAENTDANSAYSSSDARVCDLPRPSVSVSNKASSGKIIVKWDAVEGATKYKVYRATSKDGEYKLLSTTTKTQITNTSAEAGVKYYYKVKAIHENSSANSAYSTVKNRVCDLERPDVTIGRNSSGKPKLTWDKVDGAVKYKVYRATSEDGDYELLTTTSKTTVSNTSAKSGVTYYYKVRAIAENSSANSAYSVVDSIKSK